MQIGNSVSSLGRAESRTDNLTLALILAGGSGTRLHSLTKWHAKPAVPFGGKFRTIDFPLSNCINSNIRRICVLTQYKSHSLNTHIQKGWHFLKPELDEFIELLPAQQRVRNDWYSGTADAVFQNLDIIQEYKPKYVLILAGDHVYKMDYRTMINHHVSTQADMTVGCIEVPVDDAREFGVMSIDKQYQITAFEEKPAHPQSLPNDQARAMASMGIYVFNREFLEQVLKGDDTNAQSSHDFGKNIIPDNVHKHKLVAFPFRDRQTQQAAYWRDVGTIDAYYDANMELLRITPPLNLYDQAWPIWTYQEQLPPAKFVFDDDHRRGMAVDSMVSSGCVISGSQVKHSLLSNNVHIHSYNRIEDSVILPNVEIGRNCRIKKAIVDINCIIPEGMVIGENRELDKLRFHVSPKGVVLVSPEMLMKIEPEQKEIPQKEQKLTDVA